MQAVVPAAGEGTRLRPLTVDRPKGLVEVAGTPLLTHCFDALLDVGVDELVVVVGYGGEAIREYYGETFRGVPLTYTEQADPCGLADALLQAEPHVHGPFVQLNGDNIIRGNLGAAITARQQTGADAILFVEEVSRARARETGVCVMDDEGRLRRVVEKPDDPPSQVVQTGFFVFTPTIFSACREVEPSDRGEYELSDAITYLVETGRRIETVRLDGWRVNVNTPSDIRRAEGRLSQRPN